MRNANYDRWVANGAGSRNTKPKSGPGSVAYETRYRSVYGRVTMTPAIIEWCRTGENPPAEIA